MPCARGEAGADGKRCTYVETAPQTLEEVEAWDTADRCRGQLRVAPSGRVIGFDLPAALNVGTALGYDGRALAELLPSIEAGMVAGFAKRTEQDAGHGSE